MRAQDDKMIGSRLKIPTPHVMLLAGAPVPVPHLQQRQTLIGAADNQVLKACCIETTLWCLPEGKVNWRTHCQQVLEAPAIHGGDSNMRCAYVRIYIADSAGLDTGRRSYRCHRGLSM